MFAKNRQTHANFGGLNQALWIGLSIAAPLRRGAAKERNVRRIPLEGFRPVTFGVLFHQKPSPIVEAFVQAIREAATVVTAETPSSSTRSRKSK